MKKWFLVLGLLIFASQLFSQEEETVFGYSGLKLTGAWGGPVFGLTSLGDEDVFYRGGFGGLEFNKSFFLAYAAYWLNDKVLISNLPNQKIDLQYNGILFGYAMKPTKVVHPKFTLLAAGGKLDVENEDTDRLFVLQPGIGVEINIFKWWHVDMLGGYRLVTNSNTQGLSDSDVSAPFGEIKLKFGISWGWN